MSLNSFLLRIWFGKKETFFSSFFVRRSPNNRALTQTQETLKNSPNCGKRQQAASREATLQEKEDRCLSSCTWQTNPIFKWDPGTVEDQMHYKTKNWETMYSKKNTFPQLFDVPLLPTDLKCLKDCFEKFSSNSVLLKEIQKKCSLNGLDRQIPTHVKEANDFVKSKYSTGWDNGRDWDWEMHMQLLQVASPNNPNLDCLVYYYMSERKGCRNDGVCNFIKDRGEEDLQRRRRSPYIIKTNITVPEENYKNYIFRSSSPFERAISVCALLKLRGQASVELDSLYEDKTICDHFMPDVFGSLCSRGEYFLKHLYFCNLHP